MLLAPGHAKRGLWLLAAARGHGCTISLVHWLFKWSLITSGSGTWLNPRSCKVAHRIVFSGSGRQIMFSLQHPLTVLSFWVKPQSRVPKSSRKQRRLGNAGFSVGWPSMTDAGQRRDGRGTVYNKMTLAFCAAKSLKPSLTCLLAALSPDRSGTGCSGMLAATCGASTAGWQLCRLVASCPEKIWQSRPQVFWLPGALNLLDHLEGEEPENFWSCRWADRSGCPSYFWGNLWLDSGGL